MAKQTLNPDEPTVRVDLFVPTSMKAMVVKRAAETETPISQVIRQAIAYYLNRVK